MEVEGLQGQGIRWEGVQNGWVEEAWQWLVRNSHGEVSGWEGRQGNQGSEHGNKSCHKKKLAFFGKRKKKKMPSGCGKKGKGCVGKEQT